MEYGRPALILILRIYHFYYPRLQYLLRCYKYFIQLLIWWKMSKSLSVAEQDSLNMGTTKSMAISSRQKFENVDKLSLIVQRVEQDHTRSARPEQILDLIKNKIKDNYNHLYDNYEVNKNVIMKTIQQTENNDAGENAMKTKFENVVKDKSLYDRLKAEVANKQRKLKQLMDVKEQIKANSMTNDTLLSELNERGQIIKLLDQHRQTLNYETAILKNMKQQRKKIRLLLKQRHDIMLQDESVKKQRIARIQDSTHTKKILLKRIEEKIRKEDECEIPLSLAQELERKLEEYEGKYAHANIVAHEMRLTEKREEFARGKVEQEQENQRKNRKQKQENEVKELNAVYNDLLLKQAEQEKIKKICGVNSISDIAENTLQEERNKLDSIKQQIEKQIFECQNKNEQIKGDIEVIMTTLQKNKNGGLLTIVEKELEEEETQLRRLKIHVQKKERMMNEWLSFLQMIIEGNCCRENMVDKFRELIPKYENYNMKQKLYGNSNASKQFCMNDRGNKNNENVEQLKSNKKFMKIKIPAHNRSESIADDD